MEKELRLWGFSEINQEFKELKEGDRVDIQIMRKGNWKHPLYGEVKVDENTIEQVKQNFDDNTRGVDLAVDENHDPMHKALGWYKKLYNEGKDKLFATIELTKKGAELLNDGAYKYFSPEIAFTKKDEESGKIIKNLLIGGAFTNRPFFKAMSSLMASENVAEQSADLNANSQILFFNQNSKMKTILDFLAKFAETHKISKEEKEALTICFSELPEDQKNPELKTAVDEVLAFSEEEKEEEKKEEEAKSEEKSDETEAKTEEKTVEANEKGEVTLLFSEYESMKKQIAVATAEKRKANMEKSMESLKFSESNAIGIVLPKMANDVVNFALSLDEKQEKVFFEIMGKLQTVASKELGHSKDTTEEFSDTEKLSYFTDTMGLSLEEAKIAYADASK